MIFGDGWDFHWKVYVKQYSGTKADCMIYHSKQPRPTFRFAYWNKWLKIR